MAIRIEDEYVNSVAASSEYPHGSFKSETSPGALDGTPLDIAWGDDIIGFLQAILAAAGITPSGVPDTVLASDYLNGLMALFAGIAHESQTTGVHGAVSAATPNKICIRDAYGRLKVAAPSASDDVARKYEVDAEATARYAADTVEGNARVAADNAHAALTAPHGAVAAATASRLVMRDGGGDITARLFKSEYAIPSGSCNYFVGQIALGSAVDNHIYPMTIAQAAAILGLTNGAVISSYVLNASYGYIRFSRRDGTTGPMIQWDNRFNSTQDGSESFTFAYAFPSACSVVIMNRYGNDGGESMGPISWSTTGFTVNRNDAIDGTEDFSIIAIGY